MKQKRLLQVLAEAHEPVPWSVALSLFEGDSRELKEHLKPLVGQALIDLVDRGDAKSRLSLTSAGRDEISTWSDVAVPNKDGPQSSGPLVVFVALETEFEILQKRWGLENKTSRSVWSGRLQTGTPVQVLPAYGAGRVRAALETLDYLNSVVDRLPSLLVVLGICGGFAESDGVSAGDIIVADAIADLGTRKMRSGPDGESREFRISPFRTDDRVERALRGGGFNKREWASQASYDFEYPPGRVPTMRFGTLVCVDEVVSSDEWRSGLLAAWPKALGVEMEAGGVMAACHRRNVPVSVIRGVSDLANPLKADDEWRGRSLRAAASALESAVTIMSTSAKP